MSEPDPQVRVVGAQAGAQVDVNVRVTTGGAASASAQTNARRPAETGTQPNIAGFFGKRPAPKEPGPEMVGAPGAVPVRVGGGEVRAQLLVPSHGAQRGEVSGPAGVAVVAQPVLGRRAVELGDEAAAVDGHVKVVGALGVERAVGRGEQRLVQRDLH